VLEDLLDRPRQVREGEELDAEKLFEFLSRNLPDIAGPLSIEQFPAGFSNLTYLIRAGDLEFVLRRPPLGANVKTAHDMRREYLIVSRLYPEYPKVPRAIILCEDETVLGAPFYLMERVKGVILRSTPPQGLDLSTKVMRRASELFIENLTEIHTLDYTAAGLSDLGRPQGYVRRQVDGWTKRYFNARTDPVSSVEKLAEWLAVNIPVESGQALIHNDYKYDNIVFEPVELSRIVAVLDWEMATIGDPLMDLGTTLGYWVDADDPEEWQKLGFGLTALPGNLQRSELVNYYTRRTGRDVSDIVFYYAFGLLKIAVIVQQIYYRYQQGFTRDARFSNLGVLVRACGDMAQRAIQKARIDRLD
jgi:aminoglycoside phosphotransferase (APT) family kinase protein